MPEPNAALTYQDLILAVAEQLGLAYYGPNGDQAAQIPVDVYSLNKCTRYVQDGIRMFITDAPPNGWRWQRPLAQVTLWPDVGIAMPLFSAGPVVTSLYNVGPNTTSVISTVPYFTAGMVGMVLAVYGTGLFTIAAYVSDLEVTLTGNVAWAGSHTFQVQDPAGAPTATSAYDAGTDLTTVTASPNTFYPSTENKNIFVTDFGEVQLQFYLSDTQMEVQGDHSWAGSKTFNLSSQGLYTLPQNFGGEYCGEITYLAGSNRGVPINWITELEIRRLRENWNSVSGNPYYAAVRQSPIQRRWEIYIYPNTGGTYVVEFPFIVYFDKIVDLADVHPAGFAHDEAMKAACLAQAEMQGEDMLAGRMDYYRKIALPNSWRIDSRQAPRRLGYCGNPRSTTVALRDFRQYFRRPTVTYRS
jgi:hypothetical protein